MRDGPLGFHPDAAQGVDLSFEVPVQNYVVRGRIDDGVLTVPVEDAGQPDLFIQGDPVIMMDLFYGRESPAAALASKRIEFDGSLDDMERSHIRRVLEATDGVIAGPKGAAKILGLHANTLRSRMERLGLIA